MYENFTVTDAAQTRVDRFIKRLFPTLKQSQLEKWLRSKDILVNQQKVEASFRVQNGDTVFVKSVVVGILTHQAQQPLDDAKNHFNKDSAQELASWILFDDDELLVLNKPSGIATQGGTNTHKHVDKMLKDYAHFFEPQCKMRLVHRLDRDTSGVLVVAKTATVANHLASQFKMHTMQKIYWAICQGKPDVANGCLDAPLVKKTRPSGDGEAVYVDFKNGKKAQTSFRVVKSFNGLSWLDLRPHTGRTHQLRVHAAHLNIPILGDTKYGPSEQNMVLHLHARSLQLKSLDNHLMTFTASPPEHMIKTLQEHKLNWEHFC